MNKICTIESCDKKHYGLGFCEMHYLRFKKHGDPNINLKPIEKHGLMNIPEYGVWQAMKNRCRNPNQKYYGHYGGRGITVCDRWRKFSCFYKDMGPRPSPKHSLNRIDNDKGYGPDNCNWATLSQQSVNRRKFKSNTSGYKGVSLHKKLGRWRAYVSVGYKVYFFGLYPTAHEAAYVRDQVAMQLYGEDTMFNVIMAT